MLINAQAYCHFVVCFTKSSGKTHFERDHHIKIATALDFAFFLFWFGLEIEKLLVQILNKCDVTSNKIKTQLIGEKILH